MYVRINRCSADWSIHWSAKGPVDGVCFRFLFVFLKKHSQVFAFMPMFIQNFESDQSLRPASDLQIRGSSLPFTLNCRGPGVAATALLSAVQPAHCDYRFLGRLSQQYQSTTHHPVISRNHNKPCSGDNLRSAPECERRRDPTAGKPDYKRAAYSAGRIRPSEAH